LKNPLNQLDFNQMHIIEVIPLVSLPPQVPQLLSYYFDSEIARGAIVEVAVNKRKISAAVISSTPLENNKLNLKKSAFQLKKISSIISLEPIIGDIQFKLASWLSKNYFSSPGTTLNTILPNFFGNSKYPFSYPEIKKQLPEQSVPVLVCVKAGDFLGRIKPEIDKAVKSGGQALILLPELSVANYAYDLLARYYESALIHGKLGIKKHYSAWKKIFTGEAEVVIGTRQAVFSPFADLKLIIVEDPGNPSYKSDMSPKYNTRDLAVTLARLHSAQIIFVSQIPDVDHYFKSKNQSLIYIEKKKGARPKTIITDMTQERRSGNYSLFGRDLKKDIVEYSGKAKKTLLFSSRKGYASYYLCENCGFNFKCSQCLIPLRVYKSPEPLMVCHRCSRSLKIPAACPNCNSYKLKTAGYAGSEKLGEEINRIFDGLKKPEVFIFDSGTVKNIKSENEMINKIIDSESCICIATQSMFSYRHSMKFDLVAVSNFDGLANSPDFRADEEVLYQFEKLHDFDSEKIYVQTFNAENPILNSAVTGDYSEYYEKELGIRNIFSYPPFGRLVKLSYSSADKNKSFYEARILSEKLKIAIVQKKLESAVKILGPAPAFIEKQNGKYINNLILKIAPGTDPVEIVRYVTSGWNIDIDPRSIL